MLILKRRYEFWFCLLALHKLGAIAVPATHLLTTKDMIYRNNAADIKMIVAIGGPQVLEHVDAGQAQSPSLKVKVAAGRAPARLDGLRPGAEPGQRRLRRGPPGAAAPGNRDIIAPLLHLRHHRHAQDGAARFHLPSGPHPHRPLLAERHRTAACTSPSRTPAGRRRCGARSTASGSAAARCSSTTTTGSCPGTCSKIIAKHGVTTFCAPPTMYRFFIKEDLRAVRLVQARNTQSIAGEPLNPEVYKQFLRPDGHQAARGLRADRDARSPWPPTPGWSRSPAPWACPRPATTSISWTTRASTCEVGARGRDRRAHRHARARRACSAATTATRSSPTRAWHDGVYHTGDIAWRDEDGYYWFVGRNGRRHQELGLPHRPLRGGERPARAPGRPGVRRSPACPTRDRGQVVKATVVLAKGYVRRRRRWQAELQEHVKKVTAPYKYPRVIEFVDRAAQDDQRQDPPGGDPGQGPGGVVRPAGTCRPGCPSRRSRGSPGRPGSRGTPPRPPGAPACPPAPGPCRSRGCGSGTG